MNRTRTTLAVVFFVLVCCTTAVFAQEAGLVVRSPLFGQTQMTDSQPTTLVMQSFAQQLGLSEELEQIPEEQRLLSAISNGSYPITPGDTFRLVYLEGMKTVAFDLQADESCQVTIPGLGTIDAVGLVFQQLREQIYTMVQTYHSYSNPQLVFTRTGSFTVSVIGEVYGTRVVPAWGLTRLSEVVGNATAYASTREIEVLHHDGTSQIYDLYKALREGALDQDPLLASQDVVKLKRTPLLVMLGGNVYREGTYQLKEGEKLQQLITNYGGGVLSSADVQNIRVQRYDQKDETWKVEYVNLLAKPDYTLRNLDQVLVNTMEPAMQSVVIEGAVASQEAYDSLSSTALVGYPSGRIFYQFYPGETMKQMLTSLSSRFMTVSDLDAAYLLRGGERLPLNAQQILYGNDAQGTLALKNGDTVLIPFTQRLVTVSGGVVRSGVFAYVPDKNTNYYIALAGGLSDDAAYPSSVKVYGPDGKLLDKNAPIPAEATIVVAKDTFTKDIAPTVAVIGLVSSIIGIVAAVVNIMVDARTL